MDYQFVYLFFAVAPIVVVIQIYFMFRKMSDPEKMLKWIDGNLSADKEQFIASQMGWLNSHDLQRLTSFGFGVVEVVVFRERNAQRFFCFNFHRKISYAIESRFDETTLLETSTSKDSGLLPTRPNAYRQSFPGVSPEVAWQRHLEGEAYLMRKFSISWKTLAAPYEQVLINSLQLTMNHVRSIPFYPLRALYWYFVSRQRMANRSIQHQYP